jgi:cupin 2 domain-containing protein
MSAITNLFSELPVSPILDEITQVLLQEKSIKIERIISSGQSSPDGFWYDQPQNEWVLLLRGAAKISLEDNSIPLELNEGDFLYIPAHQKHRIETTARDEITVWLAIFFG